MVASPLQISTERRALLAPTTAAPVEKREVYEVVRLMSPDAKAAWARLFNQGIVYH